MWARAQLTSAILVLATVPTVGGAKDRMSLDEANRRWEGARCRSRIPITLKTNKTDDGWAKCAWIFRTPEGGNERVRVLVTRPNEIFGRYLGGTLPAGSEFVAVGWGTEKPGGRGKLFLELEHVELGARARVYYGKDWVGLVSASDLDEFEQWARLSMFEIVESPSEQLVDVDTESSSPAAPSRLAPAAVEAGPIGIRLLGASTEPLTATAGGTVDLVLTYEVTGVARGSVVEVVESRTILRGGVALTTLGATVRRGSGTHRSTQSLTIPASVEPGVLKLEATVEAGGDRSAAGALFQVVSP